VKHFYVVTFRAQVGGGGGEVAGKLKQNKYLNKNVLSALNK
jgi:hypothetical protein